MGLDAEERLAEITTELGGVDVLRGQMRDIGYGDWETARFYPIVAWFPPYMDAPDVLGIAIRDGFSFNILFGCLQTPHDRLNDWYAYVSLHSDYKSVTEALLDHHKALIATEGDMKDATSLSWKYVVEEVIDGLRPTKFNVNDDDFLLINRGIISFSSESNVSEFNEHLSNLLNALQDIDFDISLRNIIPLENTHNKDSSEVDITQEGFSEDFKSDWT